MKFITNKIIGKKIRKAGNFLNKHIHELTEEKRSELAYAMWEGIIPNDLPKHLQPFKKNLDLMASQGCEGKAWDKVINDTKQFLLDSKSLSMAELVLKYKKFLKKLSDVNYDEYDWMTTDDILFNIDARKAIREIDLAFIEKRILPDLENSKQRAWQRHLIKWNIGTTLSEDLNTSKQ